jgi:hypothetical protein
MTPKEKAEDLVSKFRPYRDEAGDECMCALIAVDEILEYVDKFQYGTGKKTTTYTYDYLQKVKQEIEKL